MTNDETINSYRACFMTDAGKRVLGHLLIEGGYFDSDLKTESEIAVQNFVKRIFRNLGICSKPDSVKFYVDKLFELGIEK